MTGVQELLAFPESFGALEQLLKPGNPLLLKYVCRWRKPARGFHCRRRAGSKKWRSALH